MKAILEWLHMGGYSFYIWSAYGLAALVLLGHCVILKWQRHKTRLKLAEWFKR